MRAAFHVSNLRGDTTARYQGGGRRWYRRCCNCHTVDARTGCLFGVWPPTTIAFDLEHARECGELGLRVRRIR